MRDLVGGDDVQPVVKQGREQGVAPVRDGQGQRYAASTARALLQAGQVKAAEHVSWCTRNSARSWLIRRERVAGP